MEGGWGKGRTLSGADQSGAERTAPYGSPFATAVPLCNMMAKKMTSDASAPPLKHDAPVGWRGASGAAGPLTQGNKDQRRGLRCTPLPRATPSTAAWIMRPSMAVCGFPAPPALCSAPALDALALSGVALTLRRREVKGERERRATPSVPASDVRQLQIATLQHCPTLVRPTSTQRPALRHFPSQSRRGCGRDCR